MPTSISYDTRDVVAVLGQLRGVQKSLRDNANGELRNAAGQTADGLVGALQSGAGGGTAQAGIVASSAKVKRDRVPAVSVGGSKRVGHRGTQAGAIVWGSEHGGRNFPGMPGWIERTVRTFQEGGAANAYRAAVATILQRAGVL